MINSIEIVPQENKLQKIIYNTLNDKDWEMKWIIYLYYYDLYEPGQESLFLLNKKTHFEFPCNLIFVNYLEFVTFSELDYPPPPKY